jgi:hypothetical protein
MLLSVDSKTRLNKLDGVRLTAKMLSQVVARLLVAIEAEEEIEVVSEEGVEGVEQRYLGRRMMLARNRRGEARKRVKGAGRTITDEIRERRRWLGVASLVEDGVSPICHFRAKVPMPVLSVPNLLPRRRYVELDALSSRLYN